MQNKPNILAFVCVLLLACIFVTAGCNKKSKDDAAIPVVPPALQILQATLPDGMVGAYYSYALSAVNGVKPYKWSIADGSLPDGLTLRSSTGLISGTPTAEGTFNFIVMVTDSATTKKTDSVALTIIIEPPGGTLRITSSSPLPEGIVESSYSVTLTAIGGITPYSWTLSSGSLPGGLSLESSTGIISGTPTEDGTFEFTVEVSDSGTPGKTASKNFTLVINPITPLEIITTSLPDAKLNWSYSGMLEARGGVPPYTWSKTEGNLPYDLFLKSDGIITGPPVLLGNFTFTATVQDSDSPPSNASKQFTITVSGGSGSSGYPEAYDLRWSIEENASQADVEWMADRIKQLAGFLWSATEGQAYLRNQTLVNNSIDADVVIEKAKGPYSSPCAWISFNDKYPLGWRIVLTTGQLPASGWLHEMGHGVIVVTRKEEYSCIDWDLDICIQGAMQGGEGMLKWCEKGNCLDKYPPKMECWGIILTNHPKWSHPGPGGTMPTCTVTILP